MLRERLAATGLPRAVAYTALPENFSPGALTAMRRYGPAALRRIVRGGSALVEEGVVDPDATLAVSDRLESGRHTDQDREAIFAVTMDAALRAFA